MTEGGAEDKILDEYLRIINNKDSEIHRLLEENENLRSAAHKQIDALKDREADLARRLADKTREAKQLHTTVNRDAGTIDELVNATESLKHRLQQSETERASADEKNKVLEAAREAAEAKRHEESSALESEKQTITAAAQAAADECQALTKALQASSDNGQQLTQRVHELEASLAVLKKTHMPKEAHEEALHTVASQLASTQASHAQQTKVLEKALTEAQEATEETSRTVARLTRQQTELMEEDARLRKAAEDAKRQLREQTQAHAHREEALQRDVTQWKQAHSDANDRLSEVSRDCAAKAEELKRTLDAAQETRVEMTRLRAGAEKTEEHLRAQLKTAQTQSHQLAEDADRCRRQHDAKEAALKEAAIALAAVKDEAARQTSDLKEKLATATAAATNAQADNVRLQQELRQGQQHATETQRRIDQEMNDLRRRTAEAEVVAQRAQEQNRDKEEELRLAKLKHQQELAEMKHAADEAVQRVRQHREAELQDAQTRLERYRAELSDNAGGHKGLARELDLCADTHRQLKDAASQHQQAARDAESRLLAQQREKELLQHQLAAQEQALAVQKTETQQAQLHAQSAQRAAEDHKASQQRAQDALAAAEKLAREATAEANKAADQLRSKEAAMQQLRREMEECMANAHQAKKDVANAELERDRLTHRLSQAEDLRRHAQESAATAQREQAAAAKHGEDLAAEVARLEAALDKKTGECRRATQRAEEVEALARQTAEELQGALTERDATITNMRREQGSAFPHLQEERTRNLVLQERLQHQSELANVQQAALRDRISELETALAARAKETDAARAEKESMEVELTNAIGQIEELERTTDAHEKKREHDHSGLRRAEDELNRYKAEVRSTMEQMQKEVAAANEIRDRYKKERAKMNLLTTQMDERAGAAEKAERAARQREAALTQQLTAVEEALDQAQEELRHRANDLKAAQQQRSQLQEQTYQEALQDAAEAEKRAAEVRMQLLESQTALVAAQQSAREAFHRCSVLQSQSTEAFADCALEAKQAVADMLTSMHRGVLTHGGRCLQDGLMSTHRAQQDSAARVRDIEQRLARQLAACEGDRETTVASAELACQQELARMAQHHRDELTRAVQAESESSDRLRNQLRDAQRALNGEREARQDLKTELELCRTDRDHHTKRAADLERECRAGEERVRHATEEVATAQGECEQLRRKLQEAQVERRHDEDELRQLRAELAALHAVMAEKEAQLAAEREQAKTTASRLIQSQDARETLKTLNSDLKEELDRLRQQLATSEAAQRRGETSSREGQRAAAEQASVLQSELATAKAEKRRLERQVEVQDDRTAALTKELDDLRRREGDLIKQVQARKGEISALRERCANLESLKNISDAAVAEMQNRERDLLEKLEELRNAQQLMQLCFDKQQEQLEIGRRMRDRDLL